MSSNPKKESLREEGTLNPHPDTVTDLAFREGEFFDPNDIVQVRYEMLRRVRVDKLRVSRAASDFGVSRPTWYEAKRNFDRSGVAGLVPQKRGPRGPHKLSEEVLTFLHTQVSEGEPIRARELVGRVQEEFGLVVHARTIERALRARKKKKSGTSK